MAPSDPPVTTIALLGSTGSIGTNVLDIVRRYPGRYRVAALAAGRNLELLARQVEAFNPRLVSVADQDLAGELAGLLPEHRRPQVVCGEEGVVAAATLDEVDTVVSAMVGAAGLPPTLAAVEAGKNVALANKEVLVAAGELVMGRARERGVTILPIDSEHSAIFQALDAGRRQDVDRIILTASGGPCRTLSAADLWRVTPEKALAHPNWEMGKKISIDSATLMNKGLEIIEARWLFDLPVERIKVLIHPQSVVHSMVEYVDGSVIAQLGIADMRIPIAYALSYPERLRLELPRLSLSRVPSLEFFPPDYDKFPALRLAYQACRRGGTAPAALNAANEVAVHAFLAGRIRFPEIVYTVAEVVSHMEIGPAADLETILAADMAARLQAESVIQVLEIAARQKKGDETPLPQPSQEAMRFMASAADALP